MATKEEKKALFAAAKEGDVKKLDKALSALLTACKSTAELSKLLRSVRSRGRTIAVVAIQFLKTPVKTQDDRISETTTEAVYSQDPARMQGVDEYFEQKSLDKHIKTRLDIVSKLIRMGADVNEENSVPTFNQAALDVRNFQAQARIIQFNVDANTIDLKLQRYSFALSNLSRSASTSARLQTTRTEETNRKIAYKRLISRAKGDATGVYERHPLVVAVRYGTVQNVNSKLRDFFQPSKDTYYIKINVASALAPAQYIATTGENGRNNLTPLMQKVLLEAVSFWAGSAQNTAPRRRAEAILQAIVGAVRGKDAIGDPDIEGWNAEGNTIMDKVWAECLAGLSNSNLTYATDFAPAGVGCVVVNELTLANPVNRFSGLRFTPSPPGPDSARRPLTAEQEEFCASIKQDFLNAAGIPQAQHRNFIWCAVNETTEIYEKSNYGDSRQGLRQRLSAYDSQEIAQGSVCLCEYGPTEDEGKHEKALNYTFGDFFSRQKYCRVVRAWDYVEFQRDDELAGTISTVGVAGGIASTSAAYFVPSLLSSGTFWGSMLAGGAVTFLALQEYFRDNNRIAVGYVESSKLAHRYDNSQPMGRYGGRFQSDAGALDLSYVYDSYRKAGSKQSAERFSRMVQAFFARRRLPQDVGPNPGPQSADAMAGTARGPNRLVPGELGAVTERDLRTNFIVRE